MSPQDLTPGSYFEVPYPFVRSTFDKHEEDEEGWVTREVATWRPGTEYDEDDHGRRSFAADDHGLMILEIISVHRPGKYPTRVFYLRRWRDPDGKTFGKTKLRITTLAAFERLLRGYRHPYYFSDKERATGEPA